MAAHGRPTIEVPAFTPASFGLLSAAQDLSSLAPDHWELGVEYRTICPDGGRTFDECDDPNLSEGEQPATGLVKEVVDVVQLRAATPFTVYARVNCPPVGWSDGEQQALAEQALNRVSGWQVEQAFSTGVAGPGTDQVVHPHLQSAAQVTEDIQPGDAAVVLSDAATVITSSVLDSVEALGLLEDALAECYHGVGMIHVPSGLGSALVAEDLIRLVAGRWRTANDHIVVLGDGYQGFAPDGTETADAKWIYATGQVWYYRSPMITFRAPDTFDRDVNTIEALAERQYVIAYDCCLFGVPVTTGGVCAGLPNSTACV